MLIKRSWRSNYAVEENSNKKFEEKALVSWKLQKNQKENVQREIKKNENQIKCGWGRRVKKN